MTIRGWVLCLAVVIIAWVGIQALVMRFSDVAPGAVALFYGTQFGANLPGDMAIVGAGPFWMAVHYDGPDLAKTLYGAGAFLVLPAGLPGCLPLAT